MEDETQKPFISIIIPAHNEENTISDSINSVRKDLYGGKTEIIIACNDCSDRTEEIAKEKGVVVVSSDKSGMGFGKNLGGKAAQGDILVFIDADSRILPGTLSEISKAYIKNNRAEIIGTVTALLDKPKFFEKFLFFIVNIIQFLRKLPTPSGVLFITRNLYNQVGGFDEIIPQGTSSEIVMKSTAEGGKFIFLRNAYGITSPRRFRKVGIVRQLISWVVNVRLLKNNDIEKLSQRDYENIR